MDMDLEESAFREMIKNREGTFILIGTEKRSWREVVLYKNFLSFDDLPGAAKSEETKKEYAEFWI